jgi:hypothetical protein
MRVLNKKYWPTQLEMLEWMDDDNKKDDRDIWCELNISKGEWISFNRLYSTKLFAFAHKEDALAFKLRWKC